MYGGEKVWDAEKGDWVTVGSAKEAIEHDPKRYSRTPPAPKPVEPAPQSDVEGTKEGAN